MKKRKSHTNEKEKLNVRLERENKMEELLLSVLEDFKDVNLHSEGGRELLVNQIMHKIREQNPKKGWLLDLNPDSDNDFWEKKRKALSKDYAYSRDLLEKKENEQLDLFPDYEGGHLG